MGQHPTNCRKSQNWYLLSCYFDGLDLIVHDMPYGIQIAEWDVAPPSQNTLFNIYNKVVALSDQRAIFYFGYCNPLEVPNVTTALNRAGFQTRPFYWYKSNQNMPGPKCHYITAVETMVYGYVVPGNSKVVTNIHDNPVQRHNIFIGPNVAERYLFGNKPVNPHEKPVWLSRSMAKMHLAPMKTALVLGSGAGGDVIGLLMENINVVSVDNDRQQNKLYHARLKELLECVSCNNNAWTGLLPDAEHGRLGFPYAGTHGKDEEMDDNTSPSPNSTTKGAAKKKPSSPSKNEVAKVNTSEDKPDLLTVCSKCTEEVDEANRKKCSTCQKKFLCPKCAESLPDFVCSPCLLQAQGLGSLKALHGVLSEPAQELPKPELNPADEEPKEPTQLGL